MSDPDVTERESGFYWVQVDHDEPPEVAAWDADAGGWYLSGGIGAVRRVVVLSSRLVPPPSPSPRR